MNGTGASRSGLKRACTSSLSSLEITPQKSVCDVHSPTQTVHSKIMLESAIPNSLMSDHATTYGHGTGTARTAAIANSQVEDRELIEEELSEFPSPRQPRTEPTNKHLQISIPPPDIDLDAIQASFRSFPPRQDFTSHCSFSSQESFDPVSPVPSLASSDSISTLSPETPATPASMFTSAADSLKQVILADQLGISVDVMRELDEFASLQVCGSSKRSGRILARSSSSKGTIVPHVISFGRTKECRIVDNEPVSTRDWRREVNWSPSDDSSSDTDDNDSDDGVYIDESDKPTSSMAHIKRIQRMQDREAQKQRRRGSIFLPSPTPRPRLVDVSSNRSIDRGYAFFAPPKRVDTA